MLVTSSGKYGKNNMSLGLQSISDLTGVSGDVWQQGAGRVQP